MHKVLAQIFTAVPVIEIDEKHSTEQARTLYWQLNKPHGWRALLPEGLRVPPEPLDGYAAAVLVKRYLRAGINALLFLQVFCPAAANNAGRIILLVML